MSTFTASGARRSGDEYQDLQSAEVLIEWLEQPDRYRVVRLEAMDGSLDDIQAEHPDGSVVLLQIKFGVDAANEWTWDELANQEASTRKHLPNTPAKLKPSLLMKWARSLADIKSRAGVALAAVVTNRAAATEISAALGADRRVELGHIPQHVKARVLIQLGGESEAEAFFNAFTFRFLDPSPDALAEALLVRFVRLGGTREGWYGLLDSIRRWINRQDEPRSGGDILLVDVQAAAGWHRPPTIPQGFVVPADFVPPERWSTEVVEPRVLGASPSTVVVTGSPGIGKSTYVSWLVDRLHAQGVTVIRHHFFLSLTDPTRRRTAWQTAADALIGQLRSDYPNMVAAVRGKNPTPDQLPEFLTAASASRADDRPVVVVIDGLDHVWRETGTSDDLNQLFDMLLPVPAGIALVVGTQSIDGSRLPAKLRAHAPREHWVNVPAFDGERVHAWLGHHRVDLGLPDHPEHAARALEELADALLAVSVGHPLVMHYAYSAARHRGLPLRADRVRQGPTFVPKSDMAGYYQALWDDLSDLGRALLHLLAGFVWPWPEAGLVGCLTPEADAVKLAEAERQVRHLLGHGPAGVTAFHESLLAFVRRLPEHEGTVASRRASVRRWLEVDAPPFWRWRYSWIEAAKSGETERLIAGPTLAWCVDALAAGRGRSEAAAVVAESGRAALAASRMGPATERHFLDTYLEEARHAESVLAGLRWLALQLAEAPSREGDLGVFLMARAEASVEECAAVAEVAFATGHRGACKELFHEGADRWNSAVRSSQLGEDSGLVTALPVLIATSFDDPEKGPYRRAIAENEGDPRYCEAASYVRALVRLCRMGGDTRAVREELRYLAGASDHRGDAAADEVVRLACSEDFDPTEWISTDAAARSSLVRAYRLLVRGERTVLNSPGRQPSFDAVWESPFGAREHVFVEMARSYFFNAICTGSHHSLEPVGVPKKAGEVIRYLQLLRTLSAQAAEIVGAGGRVDAAWFLRKLSAEVRPRIRPNDYDNDVLRPAPLAKIVVGIALDLEAFDEAAGRPPALTGEVFTAGLDGGWTWERIWIEGIAGELRPLRDGDAAQCLSRRERARLRDERDTLHVRADHYVSLAKFAHLHAYPAPEVRELMALAARNVLGHGYRKDGVLFDVLDATREVHQADPSRSLQRVRTVAPLVRSIFEITDGAGTKHLPREIAEVVWELAPGVLPSWIRSLQRDQEYWIVESCFTDLAAKVGFDGPFERALGSTMVHEEALVELDKRAAAGDTRANEVLESTLTRMGRSEAPPAKDDGTTPRADRAAQALPVVEQYPPARLNDYLGAVRDAGVFGDEPIAAWTAYWRKAARMDLLPALDSYYASHGYPHERLSGEAVVSLARELEGELSAWKWLVRYHDAVLGWSSYGYRLSDVKWVWAAVARRYPGKWLDFISETSTPRWGSAGGAPGWSAGRMVRYLAAVGQANLAQEVTDAAVQWGAGLAADMILPDHALDYLAPDLSTSLLLLVRRLDYPSRMVQERAAWALSALAGDSATRGSTVAALLAWHAEERLEMRSSLLLSILLSAHRDHGMDRNSCLAAVDAAQLIDSGAVALLLAELGVENHVRAPQVLAGATSAAANCESLDDVVPPHLAPVFLDWAGSLDDLGIGFTEAWRREAAALAPGYGLSLRRNAHFDDFYRGGSRDRSLAINDRMSMFLRSTFLRVLRRMHEQGLIDADVSRWMAQRTGILVDPSRWAVNAQPRPSWWPADPGIVSGIDALPQAVSRALEARLSGSTGPVLAYAGGPIGSREHMHAELEVRGYMQAAFGGQRPTDSELAALRSVPSCTDSRRLGVVGGYWSLDDYASMARDWLLAPLTWRVEPGVFDWLLPERHQRGLRAPAGWLAPSLTLTPVAEGVRAVAGSAIVASYHYWHDDLRERHYYGAGARVGAELLVERGPVQAQVDRGASLCWVATLHVARRGEYEDRFGEPALVGTWVVGGSRLAFPRPWSPPGIRVVGGGG